MEHVINAQIAHLPEGVYLATNDDAQGLIAQGRTIEKTLEIARHVAKKLLESQADSMNNLWRASDSFDYALVVGV